MKIISISGAHSNIGKTYLAEDILRNLTGWSALKVTVAPLTEGATSRIKRGLICPRQRIDCCVCSGFKGDFDIVTDKKIINQAGTDTARLKKAGAKRVIWLKTTLNGLKAGLKKALESLRDSEGIVVEGTSVLKYIKPNLAIYLRDSQADLRTPALEAQKKADIIIDYMEF